MLSHQDYHLFRPLQIERLVEALPQLSQHEVEIFGNLLILKIDNSELAVEVERDSQGILKEAFYVTGVLRLELWCNGCLCWADEIEKF